MRAWARCLLLAGALAGAAVAAEREANETKEATVALVADSTVGDIGDKVDEIQINGQAVNGSDYTIDGPGFAELNEEALRKALADFEEDVQLGLVPAAALPGAGFNESGVQIYQPPLQALLYDKNGQINDPSTQVILLIYDILNNHALYSVADLVEEFAYIAGLPFGGSFVLELVKTGLPPLPDTVVRAWQTDFVVDMVEDVKDHLAEGGDLDVFKQLFEAMGGDGVSQDEKENAVIRLVALLTMREMGDPEAILWQDLSAILGQPLGPALIPALKSSLVTEALSDSQGIVNRALERKDALISALQVLAAKVILFSPYFPAACIRGTDACPNTEVDEGSQAMRDLYVQATTTDDLSTLEFGETLREEFLTIFLDELGLKDILDLLNDALNSPSTATILNILSVPGPVSNGEVDYLQNLSLGNLTVDLDPAVAAASLSPEVLVCLANVSSLMYEGQRTKEAWVDGLGIKSVANFRHNFLSTFIEAFVVEEDNAVILAFEGTPYIQQNFFRGLFGWLQDALSSVSEPFTYPCREREGYPAEALCKDLAGKFPGAEVYRGFIPTQNATKIDGTLVKLVDEALAALESARATMAPEKPKLYVTGHSLGAALAKNALTQLLLRDAGDKFASVNAYTFAPPVTGNPEYIGMQNELLERAGKGRTFMILNEYDEVPYLPPFVNFSHGNDTLHFDHGLLSFKRIDTMDTPFATHPLNVMMPPLGYHSIKGQYLPLARAVAGGDGGGCELLCDTGQCGLFKCPDLCKGKL